MIKKIFPLLLIIFSSVIFYGCAENADPLRLAYTPPATLKGPVQTGLSNNISIGQISGGKETSAFWIPQVNNASLKTALEQSLQNAKLYSAKPQTAKYVLNANLDKLDVPIQDIKMNVTCIIHYQLLNIANKKIIYDKTISTSFSPEFDLRQSNLDRQQLGVEGAVKINIGLLINDLYSLNL